MKHLFSFLLCLLTLMPSGRLLAENLFGRPVEWDRHSLIIDGKRLCPVMGEVHYSRLPEAEWPDAVRKMREGGVTVIATYVFWNHIEEEENRFDWSGRRNLRRFLEVCRNEGMPVILRMGPWCHGEVRNGGLPDWLFTKNCKMRSRDSLFLDYAARLYRQIFTQVQGLQWKDGGPVIAAQFDNEYRGPAEYLLDLKRIALNIGFDLPFYTRTGWPELTTSMPFGEIVPLYGDYADGFWDKDTHEGVGNYYKAFNFKAFRSSTAIGTDILGQQSETSERSDADYPYFTCELGGGMATAYHRRPFISSDDTYSMALVKLGSGSNLLGYYMYHGGTNPTGLYTSLNECQTSPYTANNDLPLLTYDFQAPLGEFGQTYPQYYRLRPLHLFMHDFGTLLAPMTASFPGPQDLKRSEDPALRWSVRSDGRSAFIFVNNYERFATLKAKHGVLLEACGVRLPKLTVPKGCMAVFPVNVAGMRYATAQLVASRGGRIYLMQIPGIPTTICMSNGRLLQRVKPLGPDSPVVDNICLVTPEEAERLFLPSEPAKAAPVALQFRKEHHFGPLRTIVKGRAKVAAAPSEDDWLQASSYIISLPADKSALRRMLTIHYRGDCARLYGVVPTESGEEGNILIADNFYYGRPFLYGMWRLPEGCTSLRLLILPLQPDAPIYLPREADHRGGEELVHVALQ